MSLIRFLLFLMLSYGQLPAQEFYTNFYLTNEEGLIDSVTIGFDPDAADGIDPLLGEIDLSGIPMNDFEIRTGQVFNEQMIQFEDLEHPVLDSLAQYLGKREFIPKNCMSFIPVSNQAGFYPSINLFIKTNSFPVSLSWNRDVFYDSCVSMSLITDWPITTWWDIPCCNTLEFYDVALKNHDYITLYSHSGINLTDHEGDTIIMLTIKLEDEIGTALDDSKISDDVKTFPNPSNGNFSITEGWQLINITNVVGSRVAYWIEDFGINTDYSGIIFITLKKQNKIVVLRHIINTR